MTVELAREIAVLGVGGASVGLAVWGRAKWDAWLKAKVDTTARRLVEDEAATMGRLAAATHLQIGGEFRDLRKRLIAVQEEMKIVLWTVTVQNEDRKKAEAAAPATAEPPKWKWSTDEGCARISQEVFEGLKTLGMKKEDAQRVVIGAMDAIAKPGITFQEVMAECLKRKK